MKRQHCTSWHDQDFDHSLPRCNRGGTYHLRTALSQSIFGQWLTHLVKRSIEHCTKLELIMLIVGIEPTPDGSKLLRACIVQGAVAIRSSSPFPVLQRRQGDHTDFTFGREVESVNGMRPPRTIPPAHCIECGHPCLTSQHWVPSSCLPQASWTTYTHRCVPVCRWSRPRA